MVTSSQGWRHYNDNVMTMTTSSQWWRHHNVFITTMNLQSTSPSWRHFETLRQGMRRLFLIETLKGWRKFDENLAKNSIKQEISSTGSWLMKIMHVLRSNDTKTWRRLYVNDVIIVMTSSLIYISHFDMWSHRICIISNFLSLKFHYLGAWIPNFFPKFYNFWKKPIFKPSYTLLFF